MPTKSLPGRPSGPAADDGDGGPALSKGAVSPSSVLNAALRPLASLRLPTLPRKGTGGPSGPSGAAPPPRSDLEKSGLPYRDAYGRPSPWKRRHCGLPVWAWVTIAAFGAILLAGAVMLPVGLRSKLLGDHGVVPDKAPPPSKPQSPPASVPAFQSDMVDLHTSFRKTWGAGSVSWDKALEASAQKWADVRAQFASIADRAELPVCPQPRQAWSARREPGGGRDVADDRLDAGRCGRRVQGLGR